MATEIDPKAPEAGWKPYRLDVRQFLAMIEADIFPEGARVELVGGVMVEHPAKSTPHDFAVFALGDDIRQMLPEPWHLREEKSVEFGRRTRLGPDIAIIRTPKDDLRSRCPRAEEVGLLIEVADTSYGFDRGVKWRFYASAGIASYWIMNLSARMIEVHRDPAGRGRSASYRVAETFGPDSDVPVVLDGREVGRIAVREIMP